MAMSDQFTTANTVVAVNGRQITDWGMSDSPIQEEPIDPKRTLLRGIGGNATVLERINPGRRVTLSVRPGSADAAFLAGLSATGAIITYTRKQLGGLDGAIGSEGIAITDNTLTRAGASSISDDQFTFEFNAWTTVRG